MAEIGTEQQLSQSPYDPRCDQCLAHARNAFEVQQPPQPEAYPARENAQVKTLVGELTLE